MIRRAASYLRRVLPRSTRHWLYRAGRFMVTDEVYPGVEPSLRVIKRAGFAPKTAIDIGAYRGEWTVMFKTLFPAVRVLMIDALPKMADQLKQVAARYPGEVVAETALLGPVDGAVVRFSEMETGSSVYEEDSPYARSHSERTQATLDAVAARHPEFTAPDFIKLDVQGYELEVLRGGSGVLRSAHFVLLEASLVPVNKGCPVVAEVVRFMDEAGFRLYDFCSQSRRTDGVLWQTDLLFVRATSPFLPDPRITRDNWHYREG